MKPTIGKINSSSQRQLRKMKEATKDKKASEEGKGFLKNRPLIREIEDVP